jgi:hypothetical protein
MRLRKGGAFVLGIGEEKTHVSFRNACDRFILTENIASDPIENLHPVSPSISQKVEVVAEPVRKGRPVVEALDILLRGYDNAELDVGSAYLSRMGEEITKIDPSFDARTYGKRKLKDMIEELPNYFVFEKDKGGQGRDIVKRKSAKK